MPAMHFTRTMDDVVGQVESDDAGKWDQTVPCRGVTMEHGRLAVRGSDHEGTMELTPWAQGQVCSRLGMPAPYFRRCPAHLQDAQFNHWNWSREVGKQLSSSDGEGDETWLIRGKGASVRGVLSPRYARLDNRKVLESLAPVLHGKGYGVNFVQLGSESFHLRLVDPNASRDVLRNDTLMVGIHVSNSEVGLRACTVDAIVFRLICMNGLIRRLNQKSLLRQRHIHVSEPRFQQMLESAVAEAAVVAAGFIEQMAMATKVRIPDPDVAIGRLAEIWSLSKQTVELVKFALYGENNQDTLYGLVNAITQVSQQFAIEQRFEMETLAGLLIDDAKLRERLVA